jgi:glutamate synthase (NADPH/NADH) small chain
MGDPRGFLQHAREKEKERPIDERVKDWRELSVAASEESLRAQASRCMDCGIPFCHKGCPLGNLIPDFNDLVHQGRMDEAVRRLYATNNFPEITGRVCPAPCEASCVLNLEETPVAIKMVEHAIADFAFASTLSPEPPTRRTGKKVAVVGSGPAGLACAQQLARAGHEVSVFERDDRIGGLLRYGIPDFKLEKEGLDRRIGQMRAEGVRFVTNARPSGEELRAGHDAVVLAIGARAPRDLAVPGRALSGVHFAMEFLEQQNRRVAGDSVPAEGAILAGGKRVIVIGGGDTGSDCVGTSVRQGAARVVQLELMPKPPLVRMPENPWPEWPLVLRTSSSQEEAARLSGRGHGDMRDWAISTKAITGDDGRVARLSTVRVRLGPGRTIEEIPEQRADLPCDLVLLAMGFLGPESGGIVEELGAARDARGNVATDAHGRTSARGVFAAGDASRGQSLVVWAIADGRRVARGVDGFLHEARPAWLDGRAVC